MFVKNVWYIAGHSDEILPNGILGRTIVGERIVFCRRADGSVYALEDRCPHRRAPLSMGELIDGANVRCAYHGATFDGIGQCINVPGQDSFPPNRHIRTFPVIEKYRLIWVWTGDPGKCSDQSSIPDFLKLGEPPYESRNGLVPVAADYRLLVDNLLDATHAEFVHPTSFGSSDWQVARGVDKSMQARIEEFEVDMREDGIDFVFSLGNVKGGPCFGEAYAMRMGTSTYDGLFDVRMDVSWQPPGLFLYGMHIKPVGANEDMTLELINLHLLTPETEFTTHYLYRCSVNNTNGNTKLADFWRDVDVQAFEEDKRVVEGQQAVIGDHDLFDEPLWKFDGDIMSIKGRRILKEIIAHEAPNH